MGGIGPDGIKPDKHTRTRTSRQTSPSIFTRALFFGFLSTRLLVRSWCVVVSLLVRYTVGDRLGTKCQVAVWYCVGRGS